jgi:hypothetical protein
MDGAVRSWTLHDWTQTNPGLGIRLPVRRPTDSTILRKLTAELQIGPIALQSMAACDGSARALHFVVLPTSSPSYYRAAKFVLEEFEFNGELF